MIMPNSGSTVDLHSFPHTVYIQQFVIAQLLSYANNPFHHIHNMQGEHEKIMENIQ